MKIIDNVSIRYFRSIYSLTLNDCEDLTVITGKNDVGKSNILKALNLFFNNQSDYLKNYRFSDDYSLIRKEQVKKDTIRGQQFISITVRFIRGDIMVNSLPPVFSVTKRWDMHSQESKVMTSDVHRRMKMYAEKNGIKYSEKTTSTSLSTFLNRIKYVYIPAIKDDRVFEETLNILQQSLFDSRNREVLDAPISQANKAVQTVVGNLQDDFKESTGIDNFIELPNTLNYTNGLLQIMTQINGGSVSIDKRGDGIKTHYIPKILNYVAQRSKSSFIWGFEEPENSYEYRRCLQVANEFDTQYSKDSQVFITSHSPAFFESKPNHKSIVRVGCMDGQTVLVTENTSIEEELGYIELYRRFLDEIKDLEKRSEDNEQLIKALESKVSKESAPLLLTEGKTDARLLKVAIKKLGIERYDKWVIQPVCSGKTSSNDVLLRFLSDVKSNMKPASLVVGMFDRDTVLKNPVSEGKDIRENEFVMLSQNVYAFAIPVPHSRIETDQISIEHYFTDDEIKKELDGKRLFLGNEFYPTGVFIGDGDYYCKNKNVIGTIKIIEHETSCYITKIDGTGDYSISKDRFVECMEKEIPPFNENSFSEFQKIFDVLDRIVEYSEKQNELKDTALNR